MRAETDTRQTMQPAVLYVDDEPGSIKYFARAFSRDFRVLTAAGVAEARKLMESDSDQIGVLITDQRMPVETGVELLIYVKQLYPDIVRLLTTAYADLDEAMAAVNTGEIYRYVLKPWDLEALRSDLQGAMELYRRRRHERDLLQARRRTMISLASYVAHEVSTPLSAIHSAVDGVMAHWPHVIHGYRRSVEAGLVDALPESTLEFVDSAPRMLLSLVGRSNALIRLLLMNAAEDAQDQSSYVVFSMRKCVDEALRTYFFNSREKELVIVEGRSFDVLGSELLLIYVIHNLLRNSLYAIRRAGKGGIRIRLQKRLPHNQLIFWDTGTGISPQALPRVFEEFFSNKGAGSGTGLGLAFCRRVMTAFEGNIECHSREGEYTAFELTFPPVRDAAGPPQRLGGKKA